MKQHKHGTCADCRWRDDEERPDGLVNCHNTLEAITDSICYLNGSVVGKRADWWCSNWELPEGWTPPVAL